MAIAVVIAVMITIAVMAIVAIMSSIPAMIVVEPAVITIPVTVEEALSIVTRTHPARAGIGRPGPVAVMPSVVWPGRIPVTIDPDVVGPGTRGQDANDARRRRRSNPDPDRYLSEDRSCGEQR